MAASDPTSYVATPSGVLQGVAAFSWDGSAWTPGGRAGPGVPTPTGVLQGIAPFSWDGASWQPVGRAGPGVATPTGTLDGVAVYTWSGSAWTPPGGTETPATPSGTLRGVAAFGWDGAAWQPASQARPSVPTPYGVLDGVAMFNWSGSTWVAGAAVPSGATLDLSFLSGALDPRITFTRASTATYFDSSGAMQTAATNAPRFDYNPATLQLRGLLIEEARTNVLLNSATLSTQSVTTTAAATTLSFYGTGTVTLSGTSTAGPLTGTGATNRVTLTFTPTAGTLTCTVTGSVLNAQIEVGAFPTSYIPTTASAATRAAEQCYVPTAGWFISSSSYSLMMEYDTALIASVKGGIGDGVFGNSAYFTGHTFVSSQTGGGSATGGAVIAINTNTKQCGTYSTTQLKCCNNGLVGVPFAVTVAGQPTATRLTIGCTPWALDNPINGHMRRARYWPRVLSDAEMQSVTT